MNRKRHNAGFTLVELVVVVVIVGILASIAIPRISRGSGAAKDSAVRGDLYMLRMAILHYVAEHHNTFPGPTADDFVAQLTSYSNIQGDPSSSRSDGYIYGPYLQRIPPCPIGFNPGSRLVVIDGINSPPAAQPTSDAGWIYNPNTGEIIPNALNWSGAASQAENPLPKG